MLEDGKNTTKHLINYSLFNRLIYLAHKLQWDKFQDIQVASRPSCFVNRDWASGYVWNVVCVFLPGPCCICNVEGIEQLET